MANEFTVKVTRDSDGQSFDIPVTADTQEEAEQAVHAALFRGDLKIEEFQAPVAPGPGTPATGGPTAAPVEPTTPELTRRTVPEETRDFLGTLGGSIEQGVQEGLFDVADLSLLVADFVSTSPTATAQINKARDFVDEKRSQVRQFDADLLKATFGEKTEAFDLGILAGEALPFLKFIPKTKTAVGTIAVNTTAGGVFGALAGSEEANKLEDLIGRAQLGAMFGLGVSTPLVIIPGIKSFVGRKLVKALDEDLAKNALALERKVQELTGNKDFAFDIAQLIGDNPYVTGLVRGAAGRAALRQQNAQLKTLVDLLETRAATLGGPEAVVNDLTQVMIKTAKVLRATASKNYGKQINALLEKNGDNIIVNRERAQTYLDVVREAQGELGDPRRFASEISRLQKHADFLRDRLNPIIAEPVGKTGRWQLIHRGTKEKGQTFTTRKAAENAARKRNVDEGGLNTEDVKEMLEGHRQLISGETNIFEGTDAGSSSNIGKLLQARFLGALRGSDESAVIGIQRARDGYAYDLSRIRVLQNSTLGRIFGEGADVAIASPEEALSRLLRRELSSVTKTRKILEKIAPNVLHDMKGVLIRQIIGESRSSGQAIGFTEETVDLLSKALSGKGRLSNVGRRGFGLFSPGEQQELITVGKALRTLLTTSRQVSEKDAAGIFRDFTINVISQTAAFMGRFVAGVAAKGNHLERMLIDPNARRALITLAENGPNRLMVKGAIAYLALLSGDFTRQDTREQAEQERAQRRIDRSRGEQRSPLIP